MIPTLTPETRSPSPFSRTEYRGIQDRTGIHVRIFHCPTKHLADSERIRVLQNVFMENSLTLNPHLTLLANCNNIQCIKDFHMQVYLIELQIFSFIEGPWISVCRCATSSSLSSSRMILSTQNFASACSETSMPVLFMFALCSILPVFWGFSNSPQTPPRG